MQNLIYNESGRDIHWWQPVLFAAMAGGMGWGIRGQYGHETGAMIAGLLVSLTLVFLLCPRTSLLNTARAVALGTVAMGFGGSMTYGQTLGLSQNPNMVGNWAALRWGLLGCSIKGGLWIGFAGAFLGMGLSGKRYHPLNGFLLMLALVAAYFAGVYLLNSPYDPENKLLPSLYFSAHWFWEPDKVLKPRFECWGGLLLALAVLLAYIRGIHKDSLAFRLGLWGVLGGAVGFPLGECLQAYHAWNPEVFKQGIWTWLDPHMNWWNMMETTFGAVMGATLGFGLWLNRKRIRPSSGSSIVYIHPVFECILLAAHLSLLTAVEFASIDAVDSIYDIGLIMGIIPITAILAGRWWPFLLVFPITLLPIAGKTLKHLVYDEKVIALLSGWMIYFILPLAVSTIMALWIGRQAASKKTGESFLRFTLLFSAWLYFLLNYAFFRFPWPFAEWTSRTPNGIIFTICVIGLTIAVLINWRNETPRE